MNAFVAVCPICGERDGFHDEVVHSERPLLPGKALPLLDLVMPCRSCGEPLDSRPTSDCRYPKHVEEWS